ncbi:FHA domain-containing protein [Streptomyces sp. NPDC047072]|uniref:FHA domain-containing protein n=1 Tax=Streptomyces sp. NPDC047072 TaxID=3154809 RepID=UPI0033D7E224
MQIRLTVVDPLGPPDRARGRAASCDVLVTAPVGTALAAVASALASAVSAGDGPVVLFADGERLDDRRATLGEPPLIDGAVLSLGAPAAPEPHPELDDAPTQLHVVAGPDAGGVHLLHGGQIHIGRSADADVPLDDPDVSRLHCAITVDPDGRVAVADLGSTNGTLLDGTRVGPHPVRFPPGALLRIGESALRLSPSGVDRLGVAPDGEGHVRVGGDEADGTAGQARGGRTGAGGIGRAGSAPGAGQGHGTRTDAQDNRRSGPAPGTGQGHRARTDLQDARGSGSAPDAGQGHGPRTDSQGARGAGEGPGSRRGQGAGGSVAGGGGPVAAGAGEDSPRARTTADGVDARVRPSADRVHPGHDTDGWGAPGAPVVVPGQGGAPPIENQDPGRSGLVGRGDRTVPGDGPGGTTPSRGGGRDGSDPRGHGPDGTAPTGGDRQGRGDTHAGRFGVPGLDQPSVSDPARASSRTTADAPFDDTGLSEDSPAAGRRKGTPLRGTAVPDTGRQEDTPRHDTTVSDAPATGRRKGTPPRGSSTPEPPDTSAPDTPAAGRRKGTVGGTGGSRRRGGIGAWARRLAGGRGEQEAVGREAYDEEPAAVEAVPSATAPQAPEVWPDPAALLLTALGPGVRLWERDPGHPEALTVRLGTADRAAPDGSGLLPAVPVTADLREAGALGLAGPRARLAGLARAVVAQLAALHAPEALELVLISADRSRPTEERTAEWAWLGWLPHVRPGHGQDCRLLLAYDREQAAARTDELLRRLEDHLADTAGRPPTVPAARSEQDRLRGAARRPSWAREDEDGEGLRGPYTVVVVDGDPGGADVRKAVARLAAEGPQAGIHVVCLAETAPASPASPVTETYEAACAAAPTFRECGAVGLLSGDVATALRLMRVAPAGRPVDGGATAQGNASDAAAARSGWDTDGDTGAYRADTGLSGTGTGTATGTRPPGSGTTPSEADTGSRRPPRTVTDPYGTDTRSPRSGADTRSPRRSAADPSGFGAPPPRPTADPSGPARADADGAAPRARAAHPGADGSLTSTQLPRPGTETVPSASDAARPTPVGHGTVAAVDAVSAAWAERFARALAPLRTDGTGAGRHTRVSAPLPQSARLLDELGLARATPASLMTRWADAADDTESLGGRAWAVLGAGPRGPVGADLVADGPHLLIEGPAGSGRTELLRAVVASLAAAERPDRLGLVLVDGRDSVGAGAGGHGEGLRVCTDVPHVTTHLTANDPVRMREFAQSLSAELKRRAELLGRSDFTEWHTGRQLTGRMVAQRATTPPNSHTGTSTGRGTSAATGVGTGFGTGSHSTHPDASADLDSPPSSTIRLRPAAARRQQEAAPPLPRLVVVVDDLDALVSPPLGSPGRPAAGSVIRALEAVAREGERLGVHLVAAAGPDTRTAESEPSRRATLRVALDPPATGPDEPSPGRGRLTCPDGRTTAFQGGRVTGRIPRTATLRPTVVPLDWDRMGDPPTRRPVRELGNGPTDLALLASALERAAKEVSATEVPSLL